MHFATLNYEIFITFNSQPKIRTHFVKINAQKISERLLLSGWESPRPSVPNRCSNQLSYNHHLLSGGKDTT
jgi:hypothetical protein